MNKAYLITNNYLFHGIPAGIFPPWPESPRRKTSQQATLFTTLVKTPMPDLAARKFSHSVRAEAVPSLLNAGAIGSSSTARIWSVASGLWSFPEPIIR